MKSGIGLLRAGQAVFWHGSFTCTTVTASTRHYFRHAQCRCLAATGAFLIGNRLDDLDRTFALLQQTIGRSGD